jgi:hypothetical protein
MEKISEGAQPHVGFISEMANISFADFFCTGEHALRPLESFHLVPTLHTPSMREKSHAVIMPRNSGVSEHSIRKQTSSKDLMICAQTVTSAMSNDAS